MCNRRLQRVIDLGIVFRYEGNNLKVIILFRMTK